MNIKLTIIILTLIVFSFNVTGDTYPQIGGDNRDFSFVTEGLWNSELTSDEWETVSVAVSDPILAPLVADLDHDGITEIVIRDGCQFEVYRPLTTAQGTSLIVESTIAITDCQNVQSFSNFILADVDGDDYKEILMVTAKRGEVRVHQIQHSGGSLSYDQWWEMHDGRIETGSYQPLEIILACRSDARCLTGIMSDRDASNLNYFRLTSFKLTTGSTADLYNTANGMLCMPGDRSVYIGDVDYDGEEEFLIGTLEIAPDINEYYRLFKVNMNSSLHMNVTTYTYNPGYNFVNQVSNPPYCNGTRIPIEDQPIHQFFTAPIAAELSANEQDGKEMVFAMMKSQTDFKQVSISQSGLQEIYPYAFDADGVLLSNPFVAKAFPDLNTPPGVCTIGYQDDPFGTEDLIDIHCITAEEYTSKWLDNVEFFFYLSDLPFAYNITNKYQTINYLAHSIKTSGEPTSNVNLDEILNSYGVFSLDWGTPFSCGYVPEGDCTAELIFKHPRDDGVVIASEVDGSGLNDLIYLSQTQLTYINDGFQDTPGYISEWDINPCLDTVWKTNTTVRVTMKVADAIDGDTTSARAILYYGEEFDVGEGIFEYYYSFTNETEADGVGDINHSKIFGFNALTAYENAVLIKEIDTFSLEKAQFYFDELNNSPQDQSLIYDFYICPTSVSSLGSNPKSQCSSGATLIGDDIEISSLFGAGTGWKDVYFNGSYEIQSGQRYILYWDFVSGALSGEHWYGNDNDGNPSTIYTVFVSYATGTGVRTNTTKSEIIEFKLFGSSEGTEYNYDTGWSSYVSQEYPHMFNFKAMHEITGGTLRIMGRDSGRPEVEDIIDFPFHVGTPGVEFGSCSSSGNRDNPYLPGGALIDQEDTLPSQEDDLSNNPIKNAIDVSQDQLGLQGLSHSTIWLIFMLLIALAIWFTPGDSKWYSGTEIKLGTLVIIMAVMLLVGVKLDFIGAGTIITLVLISIAGVAVAFRRKTLG